MIKKKKICFAEKQEGKPGEQRESWWRLQFENDCWKSKTETQYESDSVLRWIIDLVEAAASSQLKRSESAESWKNSLLIH